MQSTADDVQRNCVAEGELEPVCAPLIFLWLSDTQRFWLDGHLRPFASAEVAGEKSVEHEAYDGKDELRRIGDQD